MGKDYMLNFKKLFDNDKKMEKNRIIRLSKQQKNIIMTHLAKAIVYNGASSYNDYSKGISILIGSIGKLNVKKILGENEYKRLMKEFAIFKLKSSRIEIYLSGLSYKNHINIENLNSELFLKYKESLYDIDIYFPCIGELLRLVEFTDMAGLEIPVNIKTQLLQDNKRMNKDYSDYESDGEED